LSDSASGCVTDAFVSEEVLNDVGSALGRADVGADASDHLVPGGGPLTAKGVLLHVVVEEFVGVEVRAVGRKEEDLDLVLVGVEPPANRSGLVSRVTVDDQEFLSSDEPDEPTEEPQEDIRSAIRSR